MTRNLKKIPIIILAGGKGERFESKDDLPKQLAKVSNHPIIIEIILYYFKNGFNFFILPLGYRKKSFIKFFLNKNNIKKYKFNILKDTNLKFDNAKINILFFDAGINSNKLSRIYKCFKYLKNVNLFGVCYGDIFANIIFKKQLSLLNNKNASAILAGYNENSPFGHIKVKNNKILRFNEKPKIKEPINIGFYFFKKEIFFKIKIRKKDDFETNFLPKLSKRKVLFYHMHNGYHLTVTTQKDLAHIKKLYNKNKNFFKKL